MKYPGFAGGSAQSQSLVAAGEQTINLMPERVPFGNKARMSLYPAPGMTAFSTHTGSPGRGCFAEDGRAFAAFGANLDEVDSAGTRTNRGTLALDGNPAYFASSGDAGGQLFVVSGGRGDILTLATNAVTTNAVAATVTFAGHLDGRFVALDATTSTLRVSGSLDGLTWTQTAQRTSASDPWLAMHVTEDDIFLIGERTGEAWYNRGTSPMPFAQRPEGPFAVGIAAAHTVAALGTTFAWLGQTRIGGLKVYWMDGYSPQPISTEAVEWAIQMYQDDDGISNAVGWSYERDGHTCYVLDFPSSDRTWVYDTSTSLWHERGFWSSADNAFLRYRPRFHMQAFDKNLVLDGGGYQIHALSSRVYTDVDGSGIRRLRRFPHLSAENRRLFFPWAELECDRGVGLVSGQGVAPLVTLRTSNNGGRTWVSSRTREIGAMGEHDTRVRWDNCGSGRDRVWELTCSDPIATRWIDFYAGVA